MTKLNNLKGEEVVCQGKCGTDFFMIINGQAEVTQRTGISSEVFSVGHLGPRLVFQLQL